MCVSPVAGLLLLIVVAVMRLHLVLCGSIGVFVLYLLVLRSWPASRAAYIFVLIPLVTVVLSAWLDEEKFGPGVVVGGLLVLAGVYFGALRRGGATEENPAR